MFWDSQQESDYSAIFTNKVTWNKMSSKFPMCMRLASLSQWMNLKKKKKKEGLDIKWSNSHPNTPVFPVSLASSVGDLCRDHEDYFLTPLEHWSVPDLSHSHQASSLVHLGDLTHISSTETELALNLEGTHQHSSLAGDLLQGFSSSTFCTLAVHSVFPWQLSSAAPPTPSLCAQCVACTWCRRQMSKYMCFEDLLLWTNEAYPRL